MFHECKGVSLVLKQGSGQNLLGQMPGGPEPNERMRSHLVGIPGGKQSQRRRVIQDMAQ